MITLLTDFGLKDGYVGIMKGVILGINPTATLIDLSHQIPPQDIQTAGFQLATAHPYFPLDTIYLVVVDPGVGSQREAIAIDLGDCMLAPTTGSSAPSQQNPPLTCSLSLDKPQYWAQAIPSQTFHGRDIFAPVAAHLSNGVDLSEIGTPLAIEQLIFTTYGDQRIHPNEGIKR